MNKLFWQKTDFIIHFDKETNLCYKKYNRSSESICLTASDEIILKFYLKNDLFYKYDLNIIEYWN